MPDIFVPFTVLLGGLPSIGQLFLTPNSVIQSGWVAAVLPQQDLTIAFVRPAGQFRRVVTEVGSARLFISYAV